MNKILSSNLDITKDKNEMTIFRRYFNQKNHLSNTSITRLSKEIGEKIFKLVDDSDMLNLLSLSKESYDNWIKIIYANKSISYDNFMLLDNLYLNFIESIKINTKMNPTVLNKFSNLKCLSMEFKKEKLMNSNKHYFSNSNLEKLTKLKIIYNRKYNFILENMPNLKDLVLNIKKAQSYYGNINETRIIDTSNLSKLETLKIKDNNNGYELDLDLDFSKNLNLKSIIIKYKNFIGDLNLTNLLKLKKLILNKNNNQNLDLSTNTNIKKLKLPQNNNQINFSMLTKLKYLDMRDTIFNQPIDFSRFPNLKTLLVSSSYTEPIDFNQLLNLEELYIEGNLEGLDFDENKNLLSPLVNLKKIEFLKEFNSPINFSNNVKLEFIKFGNSSDGFVSFNMNNGSTFNSEINLNGLTKLKELYFYANFNQNVDLSSLINLEIIHFGNSFNKDVDLTNLKNLKEITFGNSFNSKIIYNDLNNLNILYLGSFSKYIMLENMDNLKELYLTSPKINFSRCRNLETLIFRSGSFNLDITQNDNIKKIITQNGTIIVKK